MTTQLRSLFAPSSPHGGFLVEFLLIHFQERFTGDHLNTALNFPDLPSWPLGLSGFQLPSHEMKQSEVGLGLFPSSLG